MGVATAQGKSKLVAPAHITAYADVSGAAAVPSAVRVSPPPQVHAPPDLITHVHHLVLSLIPSKQLLLTPHQVPIALLQSLFLRGFLFQVYHLLLLFPIIMFIVYLLWLL